MKEKKDNLYITELFMAKAGSDFSRCFYGTIKRGCDENGNPMVWGKIKIGDGYIYTSARDQWELGDRLDEMVLMILDYGLHADKGRFKSSIESYLTIALN